MDISEIEIKSVKGIADKRFILKIMPNKPNFIVARNGFGKSSIATALSSMNNRRMKLEEKNYHGGVTNHEPELSIIVIGQKLSADKTKNDIQEQFDVTVINSGLIAKPLFDSTIGQGNSQPWDGIRDSKIIDKTKKSLSTQVLTMMTTFVVR